MNIWSWAVRRPIGVTMVSLIIVLLGFVSLYHLPLDLMPDITYPTISISASYEGASPVEVETLITRPIEQALSAIPGVETITSSSSEGRCSIRVTFSWGVDLDASANDIRDRLDRMLGRLPEGVARPLLRKFDLADFPILVYGASGNLDPVQMLKIIEDQVKFRVERVPGVAALDIRGGRKREIHVNLKLDRIRAMQIKPEEIVARLKQENISLPAGIIEAGNYEFTVRTPGEFFRVSQLRDVVVKSDGKSLVRLGEVAEIIDRWERVRQIIRVNGKPGVRIAVNKQSGKNTVEVANAVAAEVERINEEIPQIDLSPMMDSSKYIKRSIASVSSSALYGGLLAIFILLVFLRDLRSTIIIGISIPFSIIATFALMYFNDFTLNIMSLGGIALGIGMLVDNAIVVLENIFRHCERGDSPIDASIKGSEEVAAPILASTTTTLVIFLPLLFVQGMTGVMFKQLSFVVGFSLMCSLFVSLTLVPMMCSQMLTARAKGASSSTSQTLDKPGSNGFFSDRYVEILSLALRWRWLSLVFAVFIFLGCVKLAGRIPSEFMPSADEGEVRVTAEMEVGSRLGLVEEKVEILEDLVRKNVPEATSIVTSVGGGYRVSGTNRADMRMPLVEKEFRKRSSARIAKDLQAVLANIPGVKVRTREGRGLFLFRMGAGNADKIQVQVRGHNFTNADVLAKKVEETLGDIPEIADVQLSRESGVPERLISIDRKRANDLKLTISRVAQFLENLLSGHPAGFFREGGDEFRILVKAQQGERMTLDDILNLSVLNLENKPVALRNVAEVVERSGPMLIEREDQERVVNVSGDTGENSVGLVLPKVRELLRTIPLPSGFSLYFGGDYEEQQKAFRELLFSFFLALILVYMVMAIQYESLKDPFIVMMTVPFSAIGVVLALILTGSSLNVQSFIGCIMLGGIVVNNSILLVDHANDLFREKGMPLVEALIAAGRDRFRPILMTASTTILGLIPLALGLGEGGEIQAPMARVVIGGLLCSTFVSLVIIPVVYAIFNKTATRQD